MLIPISAMQSKKDIAVKNYVFFVFNLRGELLRINPIDNESVDILYFKC
jgi:hypothetical protein